MMNEIEPFTVINPSRRTWRNIFMMSRIVSCWVDQRRVRVKDVTVFETIPRRKIQRVGSITRG